MPSSSPVKARTNAGAPDNHYSLNANSSLINQMLIQNSNEKLIAGRAAQPKSIALERTNLSAVTLHGSIKERGMIRENICSM